MHTLQVCFFDLMNEHMLGCPILLVYLLNFGKRKLEIGWWWWWWCFAFSCFDCLLVSTASLCSTEHGTGTMTVLYVHGCKSNVQCSTFGFLFFLDDETTMLWEWWTRSLNRQHHFVYHHPVLTLMLLKKNDDTRINHSCRDKRPNAKETFIPVAVGK